MTADRADGQRRRCRPVSARPRQSGGAAKKVAPPADSGPLAARYCL